MGLFQLYSPQDYYKKINKKDFQKGQICWINSPNINEIPKILDVERNQPEEHEEVKFVLKSVDPDNDFRASKNRTLPIKYLNLKSTEELLVQKAKRRPAIIISSRLDIYPEITYFLKQRGLKHLQEDSLFLIPCYSIETMDDRHGFPMEMAARIRCMLYRQFFPLPAFSVLTNNSIARLDRIQIVVGKHRAAIDPTELCLSDEVFPLFLSQFLFCISGVEEPEFIEIRALVKEVYKEK